MSYAPILKLCPLRTLRLTSVLKNDEATIPIKAKTTPRWMI